jgi:hypothetical protein
MANAFLKPNVIINTVLGMLQNELILPQFIWKDGLGDFSGKYNDTVTIRIPHPTIAHTRQLRAVGAARNMTASDLTETAVDVRLTDVVYNLINLTDEERELDVRSFGVDVLPRQVRAVAEQLEYGVGYTITQAPYQTVNLSAADQLWNGVIAARRELNDAKVPRDGRVLLIGHAIEEALLLDDRFIRYDSAGQDGASRLLEAKIGRLAGYDVVVVDTIPHGAAFLFHPTAFCMVTRAPGAPFSNAVATAATMSENGVALRWLGDYDSQATTDRSLVYTWVGFKAISDPTPGFVRASRIQLTATAADILGPTTVSHTGSPIQLALIDNNGDDRAIDPTVTWSSSSGAATVVGGLVTGVSAGSPTITAVVDGVVTATLAITVS